MKRLAIVAILTALLVGPGLRSQSPGIQRVKELSEKMESLSRRSPRDVVKLGKEALDILGREKSLELEATVLDQVCAAYLNLGQYDEALKYAGQCFEVAGRIPSPMRQASALNITGIIWVRKGDFKKSRTYSLQALELFEKTGDKRRMSATLNNIGLSYDMQGNYQKALEYHLKSLEIREDMGDERWIASSLNNIGVMYKLLGNNDQALQYYQRALAIRLKLGDQRGLASLYINIGNIFWDKKDYEQTLGYYLKSLEIDRKQGNESGIASTLFNLGLFYLELKDYPKALDYYNQALKIREKLGEKWRISKNLISIGEVYQKMGRAGTAIRTISRGLELAQEIEALDQQQNGYKALATAYEGIGNYREALRNFKTYKAVGDKILNNENRKKIAEIQAKYESDKKEKEIELLKKNNKIQELMLNRQKMIRNLLIVGFLVIMAVIAQLIRKYKYVFTFWKKKHYIGHYKIMEQVAVGGMGAVYKAADVMDTNSIIALKIMREEYFADETQKKRFKQEASIIDQVVHPNIVEVIERGESDGKLYIAMELLEGPTLAEYIQSDKREDPSSRRLIMAQIADALLNIHEKNIIHRDLKPENIVLIKKGANPYFVKLLDFGLATSQSLSRFTETGMVVGTIFYLSPEQVTGGQLTVASDVYALGIIFYEMLTGRKPFVGETTIDIMKQILEKDPIAPEVFQPRVNRTLSDLVMHMIKKNPNLRPDIATVHNVLKAMAQSGDTLAYPLDDPRIKNR